MIVKIQIEIRLPENFTYGVAYLIDCVKYALKSSLLCRFDARLIDIKEIEP